MASSETQANILEGRVSEIIKLRLAGCSYRQIAKKLDITVSSVHRAMQTPEARNAVEEATREIVTEGKETCRQRVPKLLDTLHAVATGKQKGSPAQVRAIQMELAFAGMVVPKEVTHSGGIEIKPDLDHIPEPVKRALAGWKT